MSVYKFKCKNCKHKFDVKASLKEKEEHSGKFNCPKCKSKETKQVFSLKSLFSMDKEGCCGCDCGCKCKDK